MLYLQTVLETVSSLLVEEKKNIEYKDWDWEKGTK